MAVSFTCGALSTRRAKSSTFGSVQAKQARGVETDAQASQETPLRSGADGDGRLAFLQRRGTRPWDRRSPRAWPMAKQPRRELASTNPSKGAQDATIQESGFSTEISLHSRSGLQHIQRPRPSYNEANVQNAPLRRDGRVARSSWRRLRSSETWALRALNSTT
jgi:hypothetical protein